MVTPINHVIAPARFTLRGPGPLEVWGVLQHFSAKYRRKQKKVLPSESEAPGTVHTVNPILFIALIIKKKLK